MSRAHTRHFGIDIAGFDHLLLIVFVDDGFLRHHETGSHLNALRAKHEGSRKASSIRNASGCDNRNAHRVHNLGNQSHGRRGADMSAAFHAFSNHSVCACALHHFRHRNACDNGNDLHARLLPHIHEFCGASCTCGNDLNAFLHNDFCDLFRIGIQQHHVHADRLVSQLTRFAHLLSHHFRRSAGSPDNPEAASFRHGGREMIFCDPGHSALDHRIFDSNQFR